MAFTGLSSSGNLSELTDAGAAWSNLGQNIKVNAGGISTAITVTKDDIFGLNGIQALSTQNLLAVRELTSNAQSLTSTATDLAGSVVALAENRLQKQAPTSSGSYFVSATLSGQSLSVNSIPVASIATSPLSGTTFTGPVVISQFAPIQWRVTEAMPSGAIASGVYALPVESTSLLLYAKVGTA